MSILLLSTPVFASSQNLGSTSVGDKSIKEKVTRIVTVGYAVDNEDVLFLGKSNEEINNILNEKCRVILEERNDTLSSSMLNKGYYDIDGLIVSVVDHKNPNNNFYSDGNSSKSSIFQDEVFPYVNDEIALHRIFKYAVGFEVGDMGTIYGDYETHCIGTRNKVQNRSIITRLVTIHVAGGYFPVTDHYNNTRYAFNNFYHPYDLGGINWGQGNFSVSNSGVFSFSGVR